MRSLLFSSRSLFLAGLTASAVVGALATPAAHAGSSSGNASLNLTASIDRTDFGVSWNNPLPSGDAALSNDVILLAELQLSRAEA